MDGEGRRERSRVARALAEGMTLLVSPSTCTLHLVDVDSEMARLTLVVATMRGLGVSKYGDIELGPQPSPVSDPEERDERKRPSAATAEQEARNERRRIAQSGSGGPVKRVSTD